MTIYYINDLSDAMYFIHSGSVKFKAENGISFDPKSKGQNFGEIEMFLG